MTNSTQSTPACTVCASPDTRLFFQLDQVPVECNVLWDTRAGALGIPRGDMHLAFCPQCGHVFNTRFDPNLMAYNQNYENSLHFSPRFQEYAHSLAVGLVERYQLRNKQIVEVGSGKGDFLNMLCEAGDNQGCGFDPSYDGKGSSFSRLRFVKAYFSEEHANRPADFIASRHTLEHIPQPLGFIQTLKKATARNPQAVVFIEVPNVRYTLDELAIWDLIYEHCSYFSPASLSHLFLANGFDVCHLEETYENQFLTIETVPSPNASGQMRAASGLPDVADMARSVASFTARFQRKTTLWRERLDELKSSGKKAVLWGAGSKSISFLNVLNAREAVPYVVDINPRKEGKFISGAGQQIVAPNFLTQFRPDVVIIMNPIYQAEIEGNLRQLGISTEIMVA